MANENAKIDKDKLLHSLKNVLDGEISLKDEISLDAWFELKKAVYPINNYITTELTIKFIDRLENVFKNTPDVIGTLLKDDLQALKDYYGKLNVNSNGYDFIAPIPQIPKLSKNFPHITAEVKANIPYDKKKYGSSQKSGLIKDAQGLSKHNEEQKDKSDPTKKIKEREKHDPTNDYKFLVVLDYNIGNYDSKSAIDDLINILTNDPKVKEVEKVNLDTPPEITNKKIYIVMLGIND